MVNIPLCLLIAAASWWLLRGDLGYAESLEGPPSNAQRPRTEGVPEVGDSLRWWQRGQVDYGGAALMAAALAAALIGVGTGGELLGSAAAEQGTLLSWPWLVGAVVAFVLFVFYERKHPRPLVRLAFFKLPAFAAANIANFIVGVALAIGMAGLSILGQTLFNLTPLGAGLFVIQLIMPMPVGAVIGGWLADRIGCKVAGALGFLVAAVGYFLVSLWPVDPGFWTKLTSLVIAGIGLGFVLGPIGTSATTPVGQRWMATGSALVTVSRMVGTAVGLSVISSWGVRRVSALAELSTATIVRTPDMSEVAYQANLQNAKLLDATYQTFEEFFLIAAVTIAIGVIAALFFHNHREEGTRGLPFLPH
jgi:hypothetical protein